MLAAAALLAANAAGASASGQRFQVDAVLVPRQAAQGQGGFDLQATLSHDRTSLAGAAYSITATTSSIASPYVCGSDTIFANGFDP